LDCLMLCLCSSSFNLLSLGLFVVRSVFLIFQSSVSWFVCCYVRVPHLSIFCLFVCLLLCPCSSSFNLLSLCLFVVRSVFLIFQSSVSWFVCC
jgi:hypothetical protein